MKSKVFSKSIPSWNPYLKIFTTVMQSQGRIQDSGRGGGGGGGNSVLNSDTGGATNNDF